MTRDQVSMPSNFLRAGKHTFKCFMLIKKIIARSRIFGGVGAEVSSLSKVAFLIVAALVIACAFLINLGLETQKQTLYASGLSFEQRIDLQEVGEKSHFLLKNIQKGDMTERVIEQLLKTIENSSERIITNQKKIEEVFSESQNNIIHFPMSDEKAEIAALLNSIHPLLEKFSLRTNELSYSVASLLQSGYNYWKPSDAMIVSGGLFLKRIETLNKKIQHYSLQQNNLLFYLYFSLLILMLLGLWLIWHLTLRPLGIVLKKKYAELEDINNDLKFKATHDFLTGLENRSSFNFRFQALERGSVIFNKIALVLIDVDNFKGINDSFGHQSGDLVLVEIAQRLQLTVPGTGDLYRLSGDEFAYILYISDQSEITSLLNGVLDRISTPLALDNNFIIPGVSMGVAHGNKCGRTLQEMFSAADIALYHVKHHKKSGYAFYADLANEGIERIIEMEKELLRAVKDDQFVVHYQPIYDSDGLHVISLEALFRWNHPSRGLLQPEIWLEIADRLSLLNEINMKVFDLVEADISAWQDLDININVIYINVTEQLIINGWVFEKIVEINNKFGAKDSLIGVEVTESIILDRSFEIIRQQLTLIKNAGIPISLDDFGTGYASLAHLHEIPFDTIKLDVSLVSKVLEDVNIQFIIEAVILLSIRMNKKTICEGVETVEARDFLANIGMHYVQGFLYSKPLSFKQVCSYLRNR